MELYIVTLTGTAFELRVSPNDTVMSIKSKIQRFEGIPIGQQHLIWQNDELSDHQSLRDCSIPGGATLRLVLGMRGGPISAYRPPPTAAAATIRFTPTVHFASSSSQKKIDQAGDSNDDLPTAISANKDDGDSETQKQITFYFVNTNDRLEFMRIVDNCHRENAPSTGHSTTSLLGSEDSSESPVNTPRAPPISSNLLSTSVATQSLPFLQSEESALSCESQEGQQLAATTSEPSVLKASDRQASSPTTIAAAPSFFAGYIYGRDTCASDTDDCLSSDCGIGGATYFLRPPSPEWDNRDLSSTPPITVPPTLDFPFFAGECNEDAEEEDDDSLADLKDCLVYCQSGDMLFGPRRNGSSSPCNWKKAYGDIESPILTRSKIEECESLAEKMRQIRSQLSQQKQERMRRSLRQQKNGVDDNPNDEAQKSSIGTEPGLPPLINQGKSHMPKIRYRGDQGFRAVPLSQCRPYTTATQITASAVDLPTAATEAPSTSSSTSPASSIDNLAALLLPSRRRFLGPDYYFYHRNHLERLQRGAAPNKTSSETNLDAAAIIPGFAGYAGNKSGSYFSYSSSRSQRQRRFGTVQPPDFSRLGGVVPGRLRNLLNIDNDAEEDSSSLPQIFPPLIPSTSTNVPVTATTTIASSTLLRGRSPTVKKTVSSELALPPLSNSPKGNLTRSGDGSAQGATQKKDETEKMQSKNAQSPLGTLASSSSAKTRRDVASEPPRRSLSKLKTDRCANCNRRTGIVDSYTCRCERNFCAKHRYAELHACPFDYKAEARRVIRETNPVVTAAKLPKI